MNFLDGRFGADGAIRLDCGAVFRAGIVGTGSEMPVKVGIRPEHFTGRDEGGGSIDVKVEVVENLGGTRFIYGTLNSGQSVIVEDRSERVLRPGETISAGFPARKALLFGVDGLRIRDARPANSIPAE
jgi:lactose/L-arabinose transport system ATP-binding protein